MVSTCEVLWSARLNTSKEAGNRQEDRSSQWEATKRSVELSTARGVGAHRDRYQHGERPATVRHLIFVNVRRMGLDVSDRNGDRHRDTSTTVEVVWRQKSTKLWALSCLHSLIVLSPKLPICADGDVKPYSLTHSHGLVTFFGRRASQQIVLLLNSLTNWMI